MQAPRGAPTLPAQTLGLVITHCVADFVHSMKTLTIGLSHPRGFLATWMGTSFHRKICPLAAPLKDFLQSPQELPYGFAHRKGEYKWAA